MILRGFSNWFIRLLIMRRLETQKVRDLSDSMTLIYDLLEKADLDGGWILLSAFDHLYRQAFGHVPPKSSFTMFRVSKESANAQRQVWSE